MIGTNPYKDVSTRTIVVITKIVSIAKVCQELLARWLEVSLSMTSHSTGIKFSMLLSRKQTLQFMLPSMLALVLAGCGPPERAKIIGSWQVDRLQRISDRVGGDDSASDQGTQKMVVQFLRSGQLKTSTVIGNIDSTKEGTWQFVSWSPASRTMELECQLAGQTTQHQVRFEDDFTIKWIPPNMAGTSQKIQYVKMKSN